MLLEKKSLSSPEGARDWPGDRDPVCSGGLHHRHRGWSVPMSSGNMAEISRTGLRDFRPGATSSARAQTHNHGC